MQRIAPTHQTRRNLSLAPRVALALVSRSARGRGSTVPNLSDSAKPLACPACGFSPGAPFRAGTLINRPDLIHLTLRCPNCLDEWEMDLKPEVRLPPPESQRP